MKSIKRFPISIVGVLAITLSQSLSYGGTFNSVKVEGGNALRWRYTLKPHEAGYSFVRPGDRIVVEHGILDGRQNTSVVELSNFPQIAKTVRELRGQDGLATRPATISVNRDFVTVSSLIEDPAGNLAIRHATQTIDPQVLQRTARADILNGTRGKLVDHSFSFNLPKLDLKGGKVVNTEILAREIKVYRNTRGDGTTRLIDHTGLSDVTVKQTQSNGIVVQQTFEPFKSGDTIYRRTRNYSLLAPHRSGRTADRIEIDGHSDGRSFSFRIDEDINIANGDVIGFHHYGGSSIRLPDDIPGTILGIRAEREGLNSYNVYVQMDNGIEYRIYNIETPGSRFARGDETASVAPANPVSSRNIGLSTFRAKFRKLDAPIESAPGSGGVNGLRSSSEVAPSSPVGTGS